MNFSAAFIRRPIGTSLLMAGILIFGLASYELLLVSALPTVDFPTIQVSASLPGASPDTMASAVANPLEQQFADRLRPGRAARLARALNRNAGSFERRRELLGLRRFAGALAAFDRNEAAALPPRKRRSVQCLLPQIQLAAAIATRPNIPIRSRRRPALTCAARNASSPSSCTCRCTKSRKRSCSL